MAADFESFVTERLSALTRFAYLVCGDVTSAQDLVQSALTKTYARWDRIEKPGVEAYVRAAILNEQRQAWRRRWRGERPTGELPDRAAPDEFAASDDLDLLRRALLHLPLRQRAAVVLRYLEDLSEADTAAALGCSVGTVKSQTSRALAALRVEVKQEDARC